jgi:hypothetical protein
MRKARRGEMTESFKRVSIRRSPRDVQPPTQQQEPAPSAPAAAG